MAVLLGVTGRLPLKESSPRQEHPHGGAADRVKADESVVRQTDQRDSGLSELFSRRDGHFSQVQSGRQVWRFVQESDNACKDDRADDDPDDKESAEQGQTRENPSEQQKRH